MAIETGAAVSSSYLINIGVVGVVGDFFGLPLQAVFIGGLAGAVVQGLRPAATRKQGFFSVFFSVLLSGAASPLVVSWLIKNTDLIDASAELRAFEVLVPFALGAGWPWLMPYVKAAFEKVIAKWGLK